MAKLKTMTFEELKELYPIKERIKIENNAAILDDHYEVDLDRITNHEQLIGWVAHLTEKNWVDALLVREFVLKVCSAKGWNYPQC